MINLESEFSPRVNPADANYPFGSIKDNSSPGANDGTPLAAVWGNDFEGFRQAAMTEAGITPSGLPDTAQDSQLLDAVKAVTRDAGLRQSVIETMRYIQSGEQPTFDAALATAIGGYPKGAVVLGDDGVTVYRNTVDSNSTNPNTGGAGWTNEQATETVLGMMKVATQAQTKAGSADDVAITPKKLRFGFSVLLENNGYIVTPSWMGGWMLAWGTGVIPPNSQAVTLTYALAFPTKVLGGGAFHNNSTVPSFTLDANTRTSTTQIAIKSSAMTAAGAIGVNYIAIGC